MAEKNLDNPVMRLYRILESARSKSGNISVRYVWAGAFGIEQDDTVSLYLGLAELIKLFDASKRNIEQLEDVNREHYLKPLEVIEGVIKHSNLDQSWDQLKRRLDEVTMLSLQLASNTASARTGRISINEDELSKLQKTIEILIEAVIISNFSSSELKAAILEHLESIRRAILGYRISGTDGLRRAIEGTLGSLFVHREEIEIERNDKDKKQIIKNILSLIANISQIISVGLDISKLPGMSLLIGPG